MTRVSKWYRDHPVPCFLETSVRLLNILLAVVGIAMMAWSICTYVHLPPDARALPPEAAFTAALQQQHHMIETTLMAGAAAALSDAPVPPPATAPPEPKRMGCPWFIYAFGAAGAASFVTASTALIGTALRSPSCIGLNVFLMCVVLTAQACLAVALFVDKSWEKLLPPETSGQYEKVKAFILQRLTVCKWVGVAVFCVQLLTLLLSCGLQSAYVVAEDAAEDAEEEAARRRPLLQQQPVQQGLAGSTAEAQHRPQRPARPVVVPPAPSASSAERSDAWSQRMKERYGLDTRVFTYDPQRQQGQQPRQAAAGSRQGGSRCTIM